MLLHFACLIIYFVLVEPAGQQASYNVLFIMSEDMRPDLLSYGSLGTIAPNLERLAAKSVVFEHAACQVSVCAPSRASMLTGLRPDRLGIYDFGHFGGLRFLRTIPSHFHAAGYHTAQSGKTHHWESSKHYNKFYFGHPTWEQLQSQEMAFHNASVTPDAQHERPGDAAFFRDAHIADHAVTFLKDLHAESPREKAGGKPWFLSVGFKGTHMQYQMPARYWHAYEDHKFPLEGEKEEDLPRTSQSYHASTVYPPGAPLSGLATSTEGRYILYRKGDGDGPGEDREPYQRIGAGRSISTRGWEELYRGYLACMTYMDAQLGKVLDQMDALQLWDDTVVVFTADHGMHVGEKGMWSKWTLFDESARVPLMIHDPRSPGSFGGKYAEPVELLDLFPTLAELTNTQVNEASCSEREARNNLEKAKSSHSGEEDMHRKVFRHRYCDDLDGTSLRPIFAEMHSKNDKSGRTRESAFKKPFDFAITQKQACKSQGAVKKVSKMPPSAASAGHYGNVRTALELIDDRLTAAFSEGWIDFCPFRLSPAERHPGYGLMGYSLRTAQWRYTAWLLLDVNTLLPALDVAPLAEELYDHRTRRPAGPPLTVRSVVGQQELVNLYNSTGEGGLFQDARSRLRRSLYDYLYYNASFEHVFHSRVQDQVDMLHQLNEALGRAPNQKNVQKQRESWNSVVENRVHTPHPHWKLYDRHFFSE